MSVVGLLVCCPGDVLLPQSEVTPEEKASLAKRVVYEFL